MIWCRARLPMTSQLSPSPFPTTPPSLLLAVMLRCAFMQLSVMCCIHFTIMLRLVAATACGAARLCYCFCCGAKRCSLLLPFFFVALLPLLLLFCLSSSSACCGNSPTAPYPPSSCLPPLAAFACFCRFLVFNIHLKLSCPLLAPGCPGYPSPSLFLSPSPRLCWESSSCTAIMLIAAQFLWTRRCLLFA